MLYYICLSILFCINLTNTLVPILKSAHLTVLVQNYSIKYSIFSKKRSLRSQFSVTLLFSCMVSWLFRVWGWTVPLFAVRLCESEQVHGGQFSSLWFSMVGLFSWTNGYWLMGDFFAGLSDWLVVRYGRVVLSVW